MSEFYELSPTDLDPARIRREREKARKLRQSRWWQMQLDTARCYYCGLHYKGKELTMDHIVPLARGGTSTRGNLVPACRKCNQNKSLDTPVDQLLRN